ncbi:MAG: PQQ-binding-like beta-propeller repeat protein [Chitinophagaceae bacterium]|nr:PQQ-binding-like beta-propeller repeat protein [Chitinophagaceae bacterium]
MNRLLPSAATLLMSIFILNYGLSQTTVSLKTENLKGPDQQQLNNAYTNHKDWLHSSHDYSGQRYVDLRQINISNVKKIRPIAIYQAGDTRGFHTSPLVYNGIMYLTTRYDAMAIDAITGRQLWRQTWNERKDAPSQSNRGLAIKEGVLFWGTGDGHLIALNAATGAIAWKRQHAALGKGEKFNMSPLVYENLVVIGTAGSESGIQGWIAAYDITNGDEVWKFHIIPKPGDPAAATWGSDSALIKAGGGVWTAATLDVESGLLFAGTADPAPVFDGRSRPGDNLYTNCLLALDIRTGKLAWHKQMNPHDELDRGVTSPGPIYSAVINGNKKQLIATAGKDGMVRVIDRITRQVLFETPVTTMLNATVSPSQEGTRVCPGILGGVQWNGISYNPNTNLIYAPAVDWCTTFKKGSDEESMLAPHMRKSNLGGAFKLDDVKESKGWLSAIDASTGKIKWQYASKTPMVAPATTTSGGLVLTGDNAGDFLVFNAANGQLLYRFTTGGALAGGIVTYEINNKQYIAVTSGGMTSFWQKQGSSTVVIFSLQE